MIITIACLFCLVAWSPMRDWLVDYVNNVTPMSRMGFDHCTALASTAALLVVVPRYARRLTSLGQRRLGFTIALVTASGYWTWAAMHLVAGTFDARFHLPLHLCFLTAILMPWLMRSRHERLFQVLYYWTFSGVLQASLTPADVFAAPHFDYFRFWMMHSGSLLCIVYCIVIWGQRPHLRGVGWAFLAAIVFLLMVIPFNILLDANYFFLCHKPPQSALDLLGPWPIYVLLAVFVALAHFFLAYLPFHFANKWWPRKKPATDSVAGR